MERIEFGTPDLKQENIQRLGELFPQVLTEVQDENGQVQRAVDFDVLRDLLGDVAEGTRERYQFTWPGKREAKAEARRPIRKTMRPCPEESVNWDTTENLYIEGDNLDALKILKETYAGKVKMIYIDPPYNTGHDFVYDDDFAKTHGEYAAESGDYDGEGGRLVANPESNGRFHSDWCSMMYPRLMLARDLLASDGVIFISIDDNEMQNLMKIGVEVFGSDCFVAAFPWRKRTAKSDVPFGVSQDYEWIVCFSKTYQFKASVEGKERKYFESPDYPGNPWRIHDMTKQTTASERPNSYFTMVNPKTGAEYPANPNATWRITIDTFDEYYREGRIIFPGDYPFLKISKPVLRYWKKDDEKKAGENFGKVAVSTKFPDYVGMSQDGTKETQSLFDAKVFNFPKPTSLIRYLAKVSTDREGLILDYFSGSATTTHAVAQLNAEDGGSRKCILVQLPELCDEKSEAAKAGYSNICEIGKERIRRAGAKIAAEVEDANKQLKLGEAPKKVPDIGFRVLKIDSTNFTDTMATPDNTGQQMLLDFSDNLKDGRSDMDILFEVLPKFQIPYSAKIEELSICGKRCFSVDDGYLLACFDKNVDTDTIEAIAKMQPYYAVMRDASMADDATHANFEELFKTYSPDTIRRVI